MLPEPVKCFWSGKAVMHDAHVQVLLADLLVLVVSAWAICDVNHRDKSKFDCADCMKAQRS